MASAARPYRVISMLLFAISALEGIAGIILIFASNWVLALAPANLPLPNPNVVVALLKAIGIVALALAYLLYVTARDPARYVAVIDTLIFMLVAASILNVYALLALNIGALYPGPYLITRAIVQLLLAIVIFALRPRGAARPSTA
jgi:hypothetical protein